ncbi:MAG TPA: NotI family restriction endonuclease [Anaerolineae bacterium]|nr:NotI family restriction endonuclease [Anaerolineae bacterium]
MPKHPLAEVFGFPTGNFSSEAERHRAARLCPYGNKVPNCTKDKAKDPLGVCSVYEGENVVVTCPVRFRQNWIIADDVAAFFFPPRTMWTSLTEVRLEDKHGRSAGNIDIVLVAYDDRGHVIDFGALEIQAVYISGNIRRPFERYMQDPQNQHDMDWTGETNYPRPDYLSSSRKRLAPQLIYKGGILNAWGKKIAVVVDRPFFATLPVLPVVASAQADMAWFVYNLALDQGRYTLVKHQTVYSSFAPALDSITKTEAGPVEHFIGRLQEKLDEKLETGYPPDAPTLLEAIEA